MMLSSKLGDTKYKVILLIQGSCDMCIHFLSFIDNHLIKIVAMMNIFEFRCNLLINKVRVIIFIIYST
jgi:hypothetical protein